jgi:hypothetical protein
VVSRIDKTPVGRPGFFVEGNEPSTFQNVVKGEEFYGHQDHHVEPPGNGSPEDAQ